MNASVDDSISRRRPLATAVTMMPTVGINVDVLVTLSYEQPRYDVCLRPEDMMPLLCPFHRGDRQGPDPVHLQAQNTQDCFDDPIASKAAVVPPKRVPASAHTHNSAPKLPSKIPIKMKMPLPPLPTQPPTTGPATGCSPRTHEPSSPATTQRMMDMNISRGTKGSSNDIPPLRRPHRYPADVMSAPPKAPAPARMGNITRPSYCVRNERGKREKTAASEDAPIDYSTLGSVRYARVRMRNGVVAWAATTPFADLFLRQLVGRIGFAGDDDRTNESKQISQQGRGRAQAQDQEFSSSSPVNPFISEGFTRHQNFFTPRGGVFIFSRTLTGRELTQLCGAFGWSDVPQLVLAPSIPRSRSAVDGAPRYSLLDFLSASVAKSTATDHQAHFQQSPFRNAVGVSTSSVPPQQQAQLLVSHSIIIDIETAIPFWEPTVAVIGANVIGVNPHAFDGGLIGSLLLMCRVFSHYTAAASPPSTSATTPPILPIPRLISVLNRSVLRGVVIHLPFVCGVVREYHYQLTAEAAELGTGSEEKGIKMRKQVREAVTSAYASPNICDTTGTRDDTGSGMHTPRTVQHYAPGLGAASVNYNGGESLLALASLATALGATVVHDFNYDHDPGNNTDNSTDKEGNTTQTCTSTSYPYPPTHTIIPTPTVVLPSVADADPKSNSFSSDSADPALDRDVMFVNSFSLALIRKVESFNNNCGRGRSGSSSSTMGTQHDDNNHHDRDPIFAVTPQWLAACVYYGVPMPTHLFRPNIVTSEEDGINASPLGASNVAAAEHKHGRQQHQNRYHHHEQERMQQRHQQHQKVPPLLGNPHPQCSMLFDVVVDDNVHHDDTNDDDIFSRRRNNRAKERSHHQWGRRTKSRFDYHHRYGDASAHTFHPTTTGGTSCGRGPLPAAATAAGRSGTSHIGGMMTAQSLYQVIPRSAVMPFPFFLSTEMTVSCPPTHSSSSFQSPTTVPDASGGSVPLVRLNDVDNNASGAASTTTEVATTTAAAAPSIILQRNENDENEATVPVSSKEVVATRALVSTKRRRTAEDDEGAEGGGQRGKRTGVEKGGETRGDTDGAEGPEPVLSRSIFQKLTHLRNYNDGHQRQQQQKPVGSTLPVSADGAVNDSSTLSSRPNGSLLPTSSSTMKKAQRQNEGGERMRTSTGQHTKGDPFSSSQKSDGEENDINDDDGDFEVDDEDEVEEDEDEDEDDDPCAAEAEDDESSDVSEYGTDDASSYSSSGDSYDDAEGGSNSHADSDVSSLSTPTDEEDDDEEEEESDADDGLGGDAHGGDACRKAVSGAGGKKMATKEDNKTIKKRKKHKRSRSDTTKKKTRKKKRIKRRRLNPHSMPTFKTHIHLGGYMDTNQAAAAVPPLPTHVGGSPPSASMYDDEDHGYYKTVEAKEKEKREKKEEKARRKEIRRLRRNMNRLLYPHYLSLAARACVGAALCSSGVLVPTTHSLTPSADAMRARLTPRSKLQAFPTTSADDFKDRSRTTLTQSAPIMPPADSSLCGSTNGKKEGSDREGDATLSVAFATIFDTFGDDQNTRNNNSVKNSNKRSSTITDQDNADDGNRTLDTGLNDSTVSEKYGDEEEEEEEEGDACFPRRRSRIVSTNSASSSLSWLDMVDLEFILMDCGVLLRASSSDGREEAEEAEEEEGHERHGGGRKHDGVDAHRTDGGRAGDTSGIGGGTTTQSAPSDTTTEAETVRSVMKKKTLRLNQHLLSAILGGLSGPRSDLRRVVSAGSLSASVGSGSPALQPSEVQPHTTDAAVVSSSVNEVVGRAEQPHQATPKVPDETGILLQFTDTFEFALHILCDKVADQKQQQQHIDGGEGGRGERPQTQENDGAIHFAPRRISVTKLPPDFRREVLRQYHSDVQRREEQRQGQTQQSYDDQNVRGVFMTVAFSDDEENDGFMPSFEPQFNQKASAHCRVRTKRQRQLHASSSEKEKEEDLEATAADRQKQKIKSHSKGKKKQPRRRGSHQIMSMPAGTQTDQSATVDLLSLKTVGSGGAPDIQKESHDVASTTAAVAPQFANKTAATASTQNSSSSINNTLSINGTGSDGTTDGVYIPNDPAQQQQMIHLFEAFVRFHGGGGGAMPRLSATGQQMDTDTPPSVASPVPVLGTVSTATSSASPPSQQSQSPPVVVSVGVSDGVVAARAASSSSSLKEKGLLAEKGGKARSVIKLEQATEPQVGEAVPSSTTTTKRTSSSSGSSKSREKGRQSETASAPSPGNKTESAASSTQSKSSSSRKVKQELKQEKEDEAQHEPKEAGGNDDATKDDDEDSISPTIPTNNEAISKTMSRRSGQTSTSNVAKKQKRDSLERVTAKKSTAEKPFPASKEYEREGPTNKRQQHQKVQKEEQKTKAQQAARSRKSPTDLPSPKKTAKAKTATKKQMSEKVTPSSSLPLPPESQSATAVECSGGVASNSKPATTTSGGGNSHHSTPDFHTQQAVEMSYRQEIVDLYSRHNPEKVPEVDDIMKKWKGNERRLIDSIHLKYNSSSSTTSSSSINSRSKKDVEKDLVGQHTTSTASLSSAKATAPSNSKKAVITPSGGGTSSSSNSKKISVQSAATPHVNISSSSSGSPPTASSSTRIPIKVIQDSDGGSSTSVGTSSSTTAATTTTQSQALGSTPKVTTTAPLANSTPVLQHYTPAVAAVPVLASSAAPPTFTSAIQQNLLSQQQQQHHSSPNITPRSTSPVNLSPKERQTLIYLSLDVSRFTDRRQENKHVLLQYANQLREQGYIDHADILQSLIRRYLTHPAVYL